MGTDGFRTLTAELDNQGTLTVNQSLTVNKASPAHTNTGTVDIAGGQTLTISGGGTFDNAVGGTLQGTGTFNVSGTAFTNKGNVNPATSPGILSINGNYTQSATGALNIEIDGTTVGDEFDQLDITGSGVATLAGLLNVSLISSFSPSAGNSFQIMKYGSGSGAFDTLNFPTLPSGLVWSVTYGVSDVSLTVTTQFTEVGASAGVNASGNELGIAFGDIENDGDLDIYVSNGGSPNSLYQNNGDGTFTNIAASVGVADGQDGQGVTFGDYDNDDDLDLYMKKRFGANNRLYQNNGSGIFTDVAVSAGVADGSGDSHGGVAFGDYDGDGDLDIYGTNFGSANRLYRNNGDGTFIEVGGAAGVNDAGQGAGVSWGDYDNDGDLDLYLANDGGANRLYRNNGDGTFTDVASSAGVADAGPARGVSWGDYDNDGDLDLICDQQK